MARNTRKKTAEAPKVEMGAEIFASLRELEKLKGIPVDYMLERLKQALANAYRKDREDHRDVPAENVVVDVTEANLPLALICQQMDAKGQEMGLSIRIQREDIFEAMHRV